MGLFFFCAWFSRQVYFVCYGKAVGKGRNSMYCSIVWSWPHSTPSLLHVDIHPLLSQPTADIACLWVVLHAQAQHVVRLATTPIQLSSTPRAFPIAFFNIWCYLSSKTHPNIDNLIVFLQTAADWSHFVTISQISDSPCLFFFACTGKILYAFWAVVRLQPNYLQYLVVFTLKTYTDIRSWWNFCKWLQWCLLMSCLSSLPESSLDAFPQMSLPTWFP